MDKKTILLLAVAIGLIIGIILVLFRGPHKTSLITPGTSKQEAVQINPSETFIEYNDPSGFTFSYPDNLSLVKEEDIDTSTYANLQLTDKSINGSLILKISDSKFASLQEWLELNKNASKKPPKEVKLGGLKALEVVTADRLLLGALNQGVLFTIEMPLVEQDFWMKVYSKVIEGFSFALPADSPSDDIAFEGEEVIE